MRTNETISMSDIDRRHGRSFRVAVEALRLSL